MVCVCGAKMTFAGTGTRHVEGEYEAVHTSIWQCAACKKSDFSPKFAGDK